MNRKWKKDDKYIKIETVSTERDTPGIIVSSNAFDGGGLPYGWRNFVPNSSPDEQLELEALIRQWTQDNEFSEVIVDQNGAVV